MNPHLDILVVDDDCTCRLIVLHMLKKLGFRADSASNELEAIAALEKKSYDLRPRIVIVSDCSARRYRDLSLDAGAVEFLAKPAKLMEICASISRHLPEMQPVYPVIAETLPKNEIAIPF